MFVIIWMGWGSKIYSAQERLKLFEILFQIYVAVLKCKKKYWWLNILSNYAGSWGKWKLDSYHILCSSSTRHTVDLQEEHHGVHTNHVKYLVLLHCELIWASDHRQPEVSRWEPFWYFTLLYQFHYSGTVGQTRAQPLEEEGDPMPVVGGVEVEQHRDLGLLTPCFEMPGRRRD